MGYIYKISNSINAKVYIGLTTNPIEYRFYQHKRLAEKGINRALYCAMRKYGINNFYTEQIEECDNSILKQRERYWVAYYNSYMNGYNMTVGGDANDIYVNEEEIVDLWEHGYSVSNIARQVNHDRDCIVRHLKVLGLYDKEEVLLRGRRETSLAKNKIVYCYTVEGSLLGIYSNAEEASEFVGYSVKNIQKHCRDKKILKDLIFSYKILNSGNIFEYLFNSPGKVVGQYDLNDNLIKIYVSIAEAQRVTKINNIGCACSGRIKTAGGFKWKYIGDKQ